MGRTVKNNNYVEFLPFRGKWEERWKTSPGRSVLYIAPSTLDVNSSTIRWMEVYANSLLITMATLSPRSHGSLFEQVMWNQCTKVSWIDLFIHTVYISVD